MTTPAEQFKAAVDAIIARWNDRVPRNHVRVLDVYRHRMIRQALEVLSLEQILQAIDYYGGQAWQRRRNAWKRFDGFIEPTVVRTWYEEAAEAAERKQRKAQRTDARAAVLAGRVGRPVPPEVGRGIVPADLKAELAAMGDADKKELLGQAAGELAKLMGRPPTPRAIERQALAILARRRIQESKDGNAKQTPTR